MRVEGVVLEDHCHIAVGGLGIGDIGAADGDGARGDLFQAGKRPQGGGFTAAGRADEDEKLAVGNVEVEVGYRRLLGAGIADAYMIENYVSHTFTLPSGGAFHVRNVGESFLACLAADDDDGTAGGQLFERLRAAVLRCPDDALGRGALAGQ